ncbi:MAG: hypothetical protein JRJ43_05270 [Deltaproteobacteria bacterium]|nr:hypothetical protein [Deltaproteobacteria bacterium]MBW2080011.1 hypothetical protein [Deltaproteobacteria bacterium]MBW2350197.1 hypothetical protein [Deltaproteobacteria bacterium]
MRNTFKIIYTLIVGMLLCIVQPVTLLSQDDIKDSVPALSASIEQDSARVGGIVELCLKYRLPEGARLPAEPKINGIEGLIPLDRLIGPGQIRIRLLVDQLGLWKTGALSLSYIDKEGKNQVLATDPVSLTVSSNLGDRPAEAELKPIQGIIPTMSLWLKYLPWAAGLLCILLIMCVLFWWYKRGRRGKPPAIPQIPPHIRAKKEIEELDAQKLFEKGHAKSFYFRFSEILRRYLGSLRGFPSVELTTEEIARCIDKEQDRSLLALLRQADLVKFADRVPAPARKEEEVKTALTYIQETRPVPEANHETDISRGMGQ